MYNIYKIYKIYKDKLLSNYQITIQDLQGQITIKLQKTMRIHTNTKNENDRTV